MTREEFIIYFNFKGVGVEIGVWDGYFSNFILKNSNLKKLYSIDAWDSFYTKKELTQIDSYKAYNKTINCLSEFKNRSVIIKQTSKRASIEFPDYFFDFIYIDASHDYKSVKEDLESWWNKLKINGIFAGHDYDNKKGYGVIEAVDEFASKKKFKINLTSELRYKTWWFRKEIKLL